MCVQDLCLASVLLALDWPAPYPSEKKKRETPCPAQGDTKKEKMPNRKCACDLPSFSGTQRRKFLVGKYSTASRRRRKGDEGPFFPYPNGL